MSTVMTSPTVTNDRRGRGRPRADTELVTLTLSIPRPTYEKLRDRAYRKRIFKSRIATLALDEYLRKEEQACEEQRVEIHSVHA